MSGQPLLSEYTNELWGADWPAVRELWPLESTVSHLNHGSYGAVATPVLEEQQSWRQRMEANPVRFFARELDAALDQSRAEIAHFLGTDGDSIAFVPNATTAVSTVLSCFPLEPGDEVLLTDHAYGAVRIAAERWAAAAGARVVTVPVPLRAGDDEVTDTVLAAVTARTRLAIIDHVTSATARRLPLVSLVPALKERSVAVLVDAAHAPGMLAVELDRLGADYWTGNLHKWCCAPRGTAVLHVAPEHRAGVRPLVASWRESDGFPGAFNVTGTDDLTAWLAAPRALRLLDQLGFDKLRRHNVELAVAGQNLVAQALNVERADLPRDPAVSMQLVPLPAGVAGDELEAAALQARIGEQIAVEVAVTNWNGQGFVRLSAQAYNAPADYARFAADLPALL
ncbi:MAG: isopenicillin-N epimerase [Actinomycetota bacterium]|nr:isopenicillin-N epimerase [Actinomycetota bacterium]